MDRYSNAPYYLTAYGLAVKHGYRGTESEFVDELMNGAARAAEAAQGSQEAAAASAEAAALSAGTAELDAQSAASDASDAEAYSAGTRSGTAVPETDPAYHNNAAYYAGIAEDYAEHIQDPVSGLVTSWLEEHITNPSNPPIDTSLSVSGAAADAKVVGSRALLGYSPMLTTAAALQTLVPSKSANDFPINSMVSIGSSAAAPLNGVSIGGSNVGLYITLNYKSTERSGAKQLFLNAYGMAERSYTGGAWGGWNILANASEVSALDEKVLRGIGTMITSQAIADEQLGGDLNNAERNRIYSIGTSAVTIANLPYSGFIGLVMTCNCGSLATGAKQIAVSSHSQGDRLLVRGNSAGTWNPWLEFASTAFTTNYVSDTTVMRWPTMIINADSLADLTGGSNSADDFPTNRLIYVSGSAPDFTNRVRINGDGGGYYITLYYGAAANLSGAMQVFICRRGGIATRLNSNGSWGDWITILPDKAKTYHVGPTREYKTLTELWLALDGDTTEKTVYVDPGEYDVFQEYRDNNVPSPPDGTSTSNYKPYCVNIPSNTTLIGLGNVVLKWMPDAEDITELESQIWSPVNVHADGFYMENFTIVCGNGRYCIHDDPHNAFPGCHHVYKNLRLQRPGRDADRGFSMVVGMGYCDKGRYEFENLEMDNQIDANNGYCIGGHEGATGASAGANDGATVVFKDCVMTAVGLNSMRFQTINSAVGAQQRILVSINGCYLNKRIWLDKYASGSHQFFDLTLLHSGNPEIYIEDQNNPWPPKIYP